MRTFAHYTIDNGDVTLELTDGGMTITVHSKALQQIRIEVQHLKQITLIEEEEDANR